MELFDQGLEDAVFLLFLQIKWEIQAMRTLTIGLYLL